MTPGTNPVVEFLNQGRMPFVGRREELERIVDFWGRTLERETLGVLYLEGEAGIGKSRLIEEVIERVRRQGGAVIHTRLYPDASASFVTLLAESLQVAPAHEKLLPTPPTPDLGSVSAAIRRISRLRSSLLVVEDVHLLSGSELEEFSRTVQAIGDEHLSLLCAARPVDSSARGVLEPWLIEEMRLEPLDRSAAANLWRELFGDLEIPETIDELMRSTLGNPLAIRSALRGALRHSVKENRIDLERSAESLGEIFHLGVRRYADGLASHLSDEERRVAVDLSTLGEVFDPGTAKVYLELLGYDPARLSDLIAALRFKGILSTPGVTVHRFDRKPASNVPLCFTHSLFHHQLRSEADPELLPLTELIATYPALYSVVPFVTLRSAEESIDLPAEQVIDFLAYSSDLIWRLADSSDWRLAVTIHESVRSIGPHLPDTSDRVAIMLAWADLMFSLHRPRSDMYSRAIDRLLELTRSLETEYHAARHINALTHRYWSRRATISHRHVIEQVAEVVARYPAIRSHDSYRHFLLNLAQTAVTLSDRDLFDWIEKEWATHHTSDSGATRSAERIELVLMFHCNSTEEFDRIYRKMLERYRSYEWNEVHKSFTMLIWAHNALLPKLYLDKAERASRFAHSTGALGNVAHIVVESLSCRMMLGEPVSSLMPEILETASLSALKPSDLAADSLPPYTARLLVTAALLRNEEELIPRLLEATALPPSLLLDLPALLLIGKEVEQKSIRDNPLHPLMDAIGGPVDALIVEIDRLLDITPIWINDVMNLLVVIKVIEEREEITGRYAEAIRDRLTDLLNLYAHPGRRLYALVNGLLARHGSYLTEADRERWRKRAEAMEREIIATRPQEEDPGSEGGPLKISMIGEMTLCRPPAKDAEKIRGARLRRTIGILCVDLLFDRPLSAAELIRIAVEEDDPEKGKKSMKVAVHRARELLGKGAIDVREGRPWLNLENVSVDLAEALDHLRDAERKSGTGELAGAFQAFEQFGRAIGDDVLLPGLYGSIFEALRDEIEGRQREVGLRLAESLLSQEDGVTAESVARLLLHRMPEDDEIADLLHRTLMNQGRLVDAERVRTGAVR